MVRCRLEEPHPLVRGLQNKCVYMELTYVAPHQLLDLTINDKKKILSKFELLFLFFHLFSLYLVIHFIFLFNSFISEIS